jgi:EAL domain-containing protein (putative c-di-GMP-specific phosphodiesterase class I)
MDAALARTRDWLRQGIELEMAINLPPVLWQPALTNRLVGTLEAYGIDPASILIEITETAAMDDPDRTQRVLADLHAAGVRLAIDDFGTGYSSLSYVRQFPIDILKIDRSFVASMADGPDETALLHSILQLSETLHLETVAEGIEDAAQLAELQTLGADLGQGFLFARPLASSEISALLAVPGARLDDTSLDRGVA